MAKLLFVFSLLFLSGCIEQPTTNPVNLNGTWNWSSSTCDNGHVDSITFQSDVASTIQDVDTCTVAINYAFNTNKNQISTQFINSARDNCTADALPTILPTQGSFYVVGSDLAIVSQDGSCLDTYTQQSLAHIK